MQCGVGIGASEIHTPICSGSLDAPLRWFIHLFLGWSSSYRYQVD